jgi:phage terminase large subunit GpA-like protein
MVIEAVGIDTQGHNTDAVYKYCREHARENVLAMRGDKDLGGAVLKRPKAIDVTWRGQHGQARPEAVERVRRHGQARLLWPAAAHDAGAGVHPRARGLKRHDEFEQMCAERLMPAIVNGKKVMRWINPPGKRNEALDCANYAYAAACYLGIQNYREPGWARREQR